MASEREVPGEHDFRRKGDNFEGLALRVGALEERMELVEFQVRTNNSELRANTVLTQQLHEAMFGRGVDDDDGGIKGEVKAVHEALFGRSDDDDDSGLKGKVIEVHDVFTDAKRGLAFLNRVADAGARLGRPLAYFAAVAGAIFIYFKTGEWRWPGA